MVNYTFFGKSKNTKAEALELLQTTNKELRYTYGLGYRNPTTYKVPIDRDKAIYKLNTASLIDVEEYENYVHINEYSDNDMW